MKEASFMLSYCLSFCSHFIMLSYSVSLSHLVSLALSQIESSEWSVFGGHKGAVGRRRPLNMKSTCTFLVCCWKRWNGWQEYRKYTDIFRKRLMSDHRKGLIYPHPTNQTIWSTICLYTELYTTRWNVWWILHHHIFDPVMMILVSEGIT